MKDRPSTTRCCGQWLESPYAGPAPAARQGIVCRLGHPRPRPQRADCKRRNRLGAVRTREERPADKVVGVSLLRSALTMQSAPLDLRQRRTARPSAATLHSGDVSRIHPAKRTFVPVRQHAAFLEEAHCVRSRSFRSRPRRALRQPPQTRAARRRNHYRGCAKLCSRAWRKNGKRCSATTCRARRHAGAV